MQKIFKINEMLKREWRELGFYYVIDKESREWKIFGDKNGIENLQAIIKEYCNNTRNFQISEHIHLGPYSYIKIMTWDRPLITTEFIAGTIEDLKILNKLINENLENTKIGDSFVIDKEFGEENKAKISISIMSDNFDPATMDEQLQ
jgi:hypothetical protein